RYSFLCPTPIAFSAHPVLMTGPLGSARPLILIALVGRVERSSVVVLDWAARFSPDWIVESGPVDFVRSSRVALGSLATEPAVTFSRQPLVSLVLGSPARNSDRRLAAPDLAVARLSSAGLVRPASFVAPVFCPARVRAFVARGERVLAPAFASAYP